MEEHLKTNKFQYFGCLLKIFTCITCHKCNIAICLNIIRDFIDKNLFIVKNAKLFFFDDRNVEHKIFQFYKHAVYFAVDIFAVYMDGFLGFEGR